MSDWISVKDRLPEVFDEVIVYFNGFISIAWRETEKRKMESLAGIGIRK